MNNFKSNVQRFVKENYRDLVAFILTVILTIICVAPMFAEIHALNIDREDTTMETDRVYNEEVEFETSAEEPEEEQRTDVEESIPSEEMVENPVVEPVETIVEEPSVAYYDVPLTDDLQSHIFETCEAYGVDPAMVIAMVERESMYNASTIGDKGRSYGLMQIQPRWHSERMSKLGCNNLLDPYQNITVGVDFIAELYKSGKSTEWVLMAYNGGCGYANNMIAQGRVSEYASTVLTNRAALTWR